MKLCNTLVNKHEIDVDIPDNGGYTALHYSAQNGNYELVQFFVDEGVDILLKTKTGMNCLHLAARKGHLNVCKTLVNNHKFNVHLTADFGVLPLHFFATTGNYKLFKFFAQKNNDIFVKTNGGFNCVHIAALKGHLSFCDALITKHKFDVQMASKVGFTALHISALYGRYDLVKFFVNKGAYIFLNVNHGMNCLHFAAYGGHLDLCKTLINKYNFDMCMTDDYGWAPLHYSIISGRVELINFFTEMGGIFTLKQMTEQTVFILQQVMDT